MTIIKTTLSLTNQDRQWMDGIIASGEYVSNSDYIHALIRKDKEQRMETQSEITYLRAKLLKSEQSGFIDKDRHEILAGFKNKLRANGEL